MPDLTAFILERLPLIVSLSLTLVALAFVVFRLIFNLGATAGAERGYWKGYCAGITDERAKVAADHEAAFPRIVETRPDGTRRTL